MRGNAVLQTKLPRHATEAMPGQIDKERNSSILTERLCGKISASSVYDIINSTHSDVQTGHRGFCRVTSHVSRPIISQMQKKITGSISTIFRFQLLKYTFPKIETTVARATYLSSPLLARQRYHKSLDSFTFWKQCGASGRPPIARYLVTPPGPCRTGSRRIPGFHPCAHCGAVALRLLRAKPIICDGCGKERTSTGRAATPLPAALHACGKDHRLQAPRTADPRLVVLRLPRARQRHAPQCRDRGRTRLPSRQQRGPMARQEQQGDAGMFGHDDAAEPGSLAGTLGHLGLPFRWPHRLRCDVIGILGRGLRLRAGGRCGGANTFPLRTSTPFPCRRGPFRISGVPGSGAVWEVGTSSRPPPRRRGERLHAS